MHLLHEDMARATMDARLQQARATRRGINLARAARLTRRAERAARRAAVLQSQAL